MAAGRLEQARLMLWKNWLFTVRSWKTTLLQLLAPLFFLLLVTGLSYLPQSLNNVPDPPVIPLGTLPRCKEWNGKPCISLLAFGFDLEWINHSLIPIPKHLDEGAQDCVKNLMKSFSNATGMTIAVDDIHQKADIHLILKKLDIIFNISNFNSTSKHPFDINYFYQHPNQTQAGVAFLECTIAAKKSESKLNYTILYNSTRELAVEQIAIGSPNKPDGRKEIAVMIDSQFMSLVMGQTVRLNVSTSTFPVYYQQQSIATKQASVATTFLFCAITFQFVIMLYNVVSEKDLKLRQGLKLIGLKDSIYWITWAVTGLVIAFLSTIVLLITGYACQLHFFLNTEPDILFLLFFIYSASMVPLAFFASVFLNTVRQAVNIGMLVFVVGLMVIILLSNSFFLIKLYQYVTPLVAVLSFLPPFHLAKAMADIGSAGSTADTSGLPQKSYYYDWTQMTRDRTAETFNTDGNPNSTYPYTSVYLPPTYVSLILLIGDAIIYGLLAWYLDAIIRGNHGIPRKPWFPFQLSYWLDWLPQYSTQRHQGTLSSLGQPSRSVLQDTDQDSSDDDDTPLLTRRHNRNDLDAMEIHSLKKTFKTGCWDRKIKAAVDGLSLKVQENKILALLGHNGAGKSTTINMLTGLLEPDEGNAYFYGLTITHDLDSIRNILGVCPQHDVLWGDLTAMEHMKIFGYLKGIERQKMKDEIHALLEEVQLNHVSDHRVRTYSGGMKRRLSVALSFLGDPSVIFLDEPTTGMDPRIRRDIWNLILRKKRGRVTIMTTHSMEEADILGDNIAIMATGQLRVMGTSVNLKNRYAGYIIELVVGHEDKETIEMLVREKLPGSTMKSDPVEVEGGVLLPFNLPPDRQTEIVPFFTVIEKDRSLAGKILDYSISQTTLEEVFLNVTVGELFRDKEYQPALLRSHSQTTPLTSPHSSLSHLSPPPSHSQQQLSDLSQ